MINLIEVSSLNTRGSNERPQIEFHCPHAALHRTFPAEQSVLSVKALPDRVVLKPLKPRRSLGLFGRRFCAALATASREQAPGHSQPMCDDTSLRLGQLEACRCSENWRSEEHAADSQPTALQGHTWSQMQEQGDQRQRCGSSGYLRFQVRRLQYSQVPEGWTISPVRGYSSLPNFEKVGLDRVRDVRSDRRARTEPIIMSWTVETMLEFLSRPCSAKETPMSAVYRLRHRSV